jgi:hypothetical protein
MTVRSGKCSTPTPLHFPGKSASMSQWQYRKIDLNDLPLKIDEIEILNGAGGDGWELVAILTNNIAYLKRPLEEPVSAVDAPPSARSTRRKAATSPK